MNTDKQTGRPSLDKLFHEPNRMAIVAALCAADKGLAFTELKTACRLTDGNLNRHLKVLEEAGVVRVRKTFVKDKPRTTVRLSKTGLKRFQEYLAALEGVLKAAQQAVQHEQGDRIGAWLGHTARA